MQHRGVVSLRGLIFFSISSLLVLGLFVLPAVAQDAGAGPPAGTPAPGSNPDSPSSPPNLITIQAGGCQVAEGATVTLEDGDGTTARFVDGQRGIEITATGNQIRIEGPTGDFIGDHAVETSDPGFDTDGDYAVVSTTGITCAGGDTSPTRANGGTDGGCPGGAEVVETFTGTESQTTPTFDITGNEWTYVYDFTADAGGSGGVATVSAVDENGATVPFSTVHPTAGTRASSPAIEGPGTFRLKINSDGLRYTILVCEGSGGNGGNGGGSGDATDDNDASAAETQYNAADAQYDVDGKKVIVIPDTIPNKRILIDTGGTNLLMIGGAILALALVGLGIVLLRRT